MKVTLQPLSQQEVLHLTEAIIDDVGDDLGGVQRALFVSGPFIQQILQRA